MAFPDDPDKGNMPPELSTSNQSQLVPSTSERNPKPCQDTKRAKSAISQHPQPGSSKQSSQRRYLYNFSKVVTLPNYKVTWSMESAKIILAALEQEHHIIISMDNSSGYDVKFTMSGTRESVADVERVLNDLFNDIFCCNEEYRPDLKARSDERLFRLSDVKRRGWVKTLTKLEVLKKYFSKEDRDQLTIRANTDLPSSDLIGSDQSVVTFHDIFKNYPSLLQKIDEQGFTAPSLIQSEALPVVLRGENAIIIATTGNGKTLTYLLPALIHVDGKPLPRNHPSVLILAPTRELVDQIKKEMTKYEFNGIKSISLHSGQHLEEEIMNILEEVDIIIATPRKMIQIASSGYINEMNFSFVVFDEADMLLDSPELKLPIQKLLDLKHPKQTVMVSATWPKRSNWLAHSYLVNPTEVMVGGVLNVVESVLQVTVVLRADEKDALLMKLMRKLEGERVLIFCNTRKTVDKLSLALYNRNIKCNSIHAHIEYQQRKIVLEQVLGGECNVLVATDLVSRGIDFKDFNIVINADFPRKIENYIYRVGRVGREGGNRSVAINLFTQQDKAYAKGLIKVLERGQQNVPEGLLDMAEKFDRLGYSADGARHVDRFF